jgi:hypothetical protein
MMHARVYLANGRVFLVYVTVTAAGGDDALAARYLDSFRILKNVANR